ncbi:MAG: protein translocase subunit SecF [Treponema sp.]|jgi:preprotein translocase subunit SecF|nr:protein translocase subunit SecF [Treponema sp.]
MRKIMRFSNLFFPAMIFSIILTGAGLVSYFVMGGFNLGVDFRAGLIQEVQFAPTAFSLTWSGRGNAVISFDRNGLYIVNSGVGVESRTVAFPFNEYGTVGVLSQSLMSRVEGLNVRLNIAEGTSSQWLVRSAQGNPYLGGNPYMVHYLDPQSPEIKIETVRDAVSSLGQTVAVQSLGQPQDRHFMIRLDDKRAEEGEDNSAAGISAAEKITDILEGHFGSGEVVVLRSDYVGSRFSKDLTDQAGILMGFTLLLILAYASIRFKPQYAVGAVIGIIHDSLVIVAFVVWSRMEFNTSTIAAILTILGYSINNTIVIFDRIRENRRIYPDEVFITVMNRSLTETLSRTIITTLTTMLAIVSLFIFTTGSMKDFALALLVGMLSGVYTSIFIAPAFVNFWEKQKVKREKQKLTAPAGQLKGAVSKA